MLALASVLPAELARFGLFQGCSKVTKGRPRAQDVLALASVPPAELAQAVWVGMSGATQARRCARPQGPRGLAGGSLCRLLNCWRHAGTPLLHPRTSSLQRA
jgi:hypothetical protein